MFWSAQGGFFKKKKKERKKESPSVLIPTQTSKDCSHGQWHGGLFGGGNLTSTHLGFKGKWVDFLVPKHPA